jgi:hypothetical protein
VVLGIGAVGLLAACGTPPESLAVRGDAASSASESTAASPTTTTASVVGPPTPTTPDEQAMPTTPATAANPVSVSYRTVTVTAKIPFTTRTVKDATMAAGTNRVRTRGVAGVATLTYRVTLRDGVEGGRALVRRVVTKAPVTRVSVVGTRASASCDPNYAGACVPIASDVDCAGGSGNGPAYVRGPVKVIGTDIYDLDSDNDGLGCE